ncbi:MAG: UbiA family prenyltransferase [Planctomycetia bacterium]|nr:UbiA family prenyltransferase [Planctomycetia bacterium]
MNNSSGWLKQVRLFLEMIRFSHTLFALPFALAGAVLAWRASGRTKPFEIFIDIAGIIPCMVLARTWAMAINRLVDRKIDAANPRTEKRHLPAGLLSVQAVTWFAILSAIGFVISTIHFWVWNENLWPLILSIPVLLFIAGYSFTKRFTALCHVWLGLSLMLAPIAAWLAITGSLSWTPVVLGLAVLFWVTGFDILYATQDVDFDTKAKLHSIPAALGVNNALRVAFLSHICMVLCLLILYFIAELGMIYLVGIILVACLLCYEHAIVKPNDLSRVNQAFFQVNGVISVGMLVIIIVDVCFQKSA